MKKRFAHLFAFSAALILMGPWMTARVSAQDCAIPSTFYRFVVSPYDGGHLLTGYYPEGPANGYPWDGGLVNPGSAWLGIYFHPNNGNVPDPASGLVPLYRWTVIQDGWRTHYYYSTYYTQQPSDRYFNGIAGYVFPPSQTNYLGIGLRPLAIWYSSQRGFWYGYESVPAGNPGFQEQPPHWSYNYQGVIANLPPAVWDYQFPPSPSTGPPIGSSVWTICFVQPSGGGGGGGGECNVPQSTVNACQHNGGWWDYDVCQCQY